MKKVRLFTLVLALILFVSIAQAEETFEQATERVLSKKGMQGDVIIDELPFVIPYDSKTVTLESIECYEKKENHGYKLFVVLQFDAKNLDDDQLYWFQRDLLEPIGGISIKASSKDSVSDSYLFYLGRQTEEKRNKRKLYYVAMSSSEARKSYSGGQISLFAYNLTPEVDFYYYRFDIPEKLLYYYAMDNKTLISKINEWVKNLSN